MKKEDKDLVLEQADEFANKLDSLKKESSEVYSNKSNKPDEIHEEIVETIPEEKPKTPQNSYTKKGSSFGYKDVLILLLAFALVFLTTQFYRQNTNNDNSLIPSWKDIDVIEYINKTQPVTTVKKVSVVITSAAYTDDILSLNFTVMNNNENIIRFLTSSFRIKIKDTVITPIIEGTINENDVNSASGVNPGDSVNITLNYDLEPSQLVGEEIILKGIFITNLGTYDIEYLMPSLDSER